MNLRPTTIFLRTRFWASFLRESLSISVAFSRSLRSAFSDSASDFLRILVSARSVRRFLRAFASATFLIDRALIACVRRDVVSARGHSEARGATLQGKWHLHRVARAVECFRRQFHAITGRARVLALVVEEPLSQRNREARPSDGERVAVSGAQAKPEAGRGR